MIDLISRQALLDWIKYHDNEREDLFPVFKHVKSMPSVYPERKKGRWINRDDTVSGFYHEVSQCSECDWFTDLFSRDEMLYCPNCGADMRGENDD